MAVIERRYAKALLDSSKENAGSFEKLLCDFKNAFCTEIQFKKVLLDPRLDKAEKMNVINEMFSEKKDTIFSNFIKVLLDNNRIELIPGIYDEYVKILHCKNNELFIKIFSAGELNDSEINGITDKYKKMYEVSNVLFEIIYDESLLGGVKVVVGNVVYDGSLKRQLHNML